MSVLSGNNFSSLRSAIFFLFGSVFSISASTFLAVDANAVNFPPYIVNNMGLSSGNVVRQVSRLREKKDSFSLGNTRKPAKEAKMCDLLILRVGK